LEVEGTQNNNALFASAFSFSNTNNNVTFDPTAKAEAKLLKRGVTIASGIAQLDRVVQVRDKLTFFITLYADTVDIFQILKNVKVSELPWDEYTHTLTQANIVASFSQAIGSGYKYFPTERGFGRPGALIWRVTDMHIFVYFKEVFDKIMEYLDQDYTSTYMNTDRYKSRLFGTGGGKPPQVSAQDIDDRLIDVDAGTFSYSEYNFPTIPSGTSGNYAETSFPTELLADSNTTYTVTQDTLGQFNDYEITAAQEGNYRLTYVKTLDWSYSVGSNNFLFGGAPRLELIKNGAVIDTSVTLAPASALLGQSGTAVYDFTRNLFVQPGDQIQIRFVPQLCRTQYAIDPVRLDVNNNGAITINWDSLDTALTNGSTIEVNRFLPDMKCSDFLLGALRQDYLYMSEPDDEGVIRIEPLASFYRPTTDFVDITQKIDYNKPIETVFSANEYAKTTIFKYAEIKEFDATDYEAQWGEKYGDKTLEQGSFHASGQRKIELPWGTIIPFNIQDGLLMPRFITIDDTGAAKEYKGPARIALDGGLKSVNWLLRDAGQIWNETGQALYPSMHHFDDYENPTFDLNFKLVRQLYYNTGLFTTRNTYSEYYYQFINELTSPSGQIKKLYRRYKDTEIRDLDFSYLRMINGRLYRLNTVTDFDSDKSASTKIELVKVLEAKNSQAIELAIPPRDGGDVGGLNESPLGVGEDVGVADGGDNDTTENNPLISG